MTNKQIHRWIIEVTAQFIKGSGIDGSFVECGVKQGTSSRIMASTLDREGYLFDTWTGFPHYSKKYDVPSKDRIRRLDKRVKDVSSNYKQCVRALKNSKIMHLCTLVRGDICKTVPKFIKRREPKVCMMHIDTDLHDPAEISLHAFRPCVVEDGIIVFHDYKDKKWPGISKIVDSFVAKYSWGFVDMNIEVGIKAAVVINGDSLEYVEYIRRNWGKVNDA